MNSGKTRDAFTLVELLMVVTILAVLAAIAIPNLLQSQTRAKVAKAQSGMRVAAMALEAYRADGTMYPLRPIDPAAGPNAIIVILPNALTTPIAYVSGDESLMDPLKTLKGTRENARFHRRLIYFDWQNLINPALPQYSERHADEAALYGGWTLASVGPDTHIGPLGDENTYFGYSYDPTNGTTSGGDVLRSHRFSH